MNVQKKVDQICYLAATAAIEAGACISGLFAGADSWLFACGELALQL
jgi:hypothetical protein